MEKVVNKVYGREERLRDSFSKIKGGDKLWVQYRDKVGLYRFKTIKGICLKNVKKGMLDLVSFGLRPN